MAALQALYHSAGGSTWRNSTGWLDSSWRPCMNWHGVGCARADDGSEIITSLHLHMNNLRGTLPSEVGRLHLEDLVLSDNPYLSGTLPTELFGLAGTRGRLNLSGSSVSGTLPAHAQWLGSASPAQLSGTQRGSTAQRPTGRPVAARQLQGGADLGDLFAYYGMPGPDPMDEVEPRSTLDTVLYWIGKNLLGVTLTTETLAYWWKEDIMKRLRAPLDGLLLPMLLVFAVMTAWREVFTAQGRVDIV